MFLHNAAMLGRIGDSFSLRSFSTNSLYLYLVLRQTKAENPVSHKYVVANGINVLIARFARSGYSARKLIQKSVSVFWPNSILTDPFVDISMRLSLSSIGNCHVLGDEKGLRIHVSWSSVSGKYLRNCAAKSPRCFRMSHLTLSASHSSFSHRKSCSDGNAPMSLSLTQSDQKFSFLIVASTLSRTLNIVTERPCSPRLSSFRRPKISPK